MDHALVVGEALVDVVVRADATSDRHPGGSPANVAVGLGRLGRDVELATWIGDDDDGAKVRDHLGASGVRLVAGSETAQRTSVATARLDPGGAAAYTFDLAWDLPTELVPRPAPLVVHTGSIATLLPPGADAVTCVLDQHRPTSTITYDPNLRPSIVGPVGPARRTVEHLVTMCDVVKASAEDLAWLLPDEDPADVATRWASAGPGLVVVTLGSAGALAVTAAGAKVRTAAPHVTVADTVGAGDSFMAGLIDGLWSADLLGSDHREALRTAPAATMEQVLTRCTQIATITCSRPGADPPTPAELASSGW
ncbi:MAG: carbohydrate kinase [Micrococcales bacterium]|nr:carbohydrate kinase [Micrococcales bacterium]MCL2668422.1 carbohydrate kinase [Micrococcales bacterium]